MDQKKKPARIRWTTAWRRNNKKTEVNLLKVYTKQAAEKSKRRINKSYKVKRPIAGMSVEANKKRRQQKDEITKKSREAALA